MSRNGLLKNPVRLYNLLRNDIRTALDEQVILNEDLYYKDTLIIKAGSYLDDQVIYRLLNFGIKSVNIQLPENNTGKPVIKTNTFGDIKKLFLKQQKCIVADKDAYYINQLISALKSSHITESNILAVNNTIPIKKLIEDNCPKFVFIDLNLYPDNGLKVIKEINKLSLNTNIYLTALINHSKTALVDKLNKEVEKSNASLIYKPVSPSQIKLLVMNSISQKDIKNFMTIKRLQQNRIKSA